MNTGAHGIDDRLSELTKKIQYEKDMYAKLPPYLVNIRNMMGSRNIFALESYYAKAVDNDEDIMSLVETAMALTKASLNDTPLPENLDLSDVKRLFDIFLSYHDKSVALFFKVRVAPLCATDSSEWLTH